MVLIFAAPTPVPAPPPNPWLGMTCVWTGADGSVWDLAEGSEGVALQSGAEGFHEPPLTVHTSTSRAVPGERIRGWRAEARPVFWPLQVEGESADVWRDRYNRFFRSIHPQIPGTWRVGQGGTFRELSLTGAYGGAYRMETDPHVLGHERFGVALTAAQPYWTGQKVERGPWKAPASQDFRPAGGDPMFYISSASAFADASIPNSGDVAAFPVWQVVGPLEAIELGVGGRIIEVPFDVEDGETLIIDTDPRNVTATLDGVDVTADLGFQPFAPVEPAEDAALHVSATGTGSVAVSLTPLFLRAF